MADGKKTGGVRCKKYDGEVFGMLRVVKDFEDKSKKQRRVVCKCECGETCTVYLHNIKRGFTKSCGCYSRKAKHNYKHGQSETKIYRLWRAMINRCTNKNNAAYPNYGGRGITVCDSWLESFENFMNDMGIRPKGTSLDRIDNNKGYSPENCRWSTQKEQSRNTRSNVYIDGLVRVDFLRKHGVSSNSLYRWVDAGMSLEDIIHRAKSKKRTHFNKKIIGGQIAS